MLLKVDVVESGRQQEKGQRWKSLRTAMLFSAVCFHIEHVHVVMNDRRVDVKIPWREVASPNQHDGIVDSDQKVVNKELSVS